MMSVKDWLEQLGELPDDRDALKGEQFRLVNLGLSEYALNVLADQDPRATTQDSRGRGDTWGIPPLTPPLGGV